MQIVINISEENYKNIKEQVNKSDYPDMQIGIAIANGTPLPKGHKRLIEDNFEVGPVFDEKGNRVGYRYVTQYELNNAPTIIEADKESDS